MTCPHGDHASVHMGNQARSRPIRKREFVPIKQLPRSDSWSRVVAQAGLVVRPASARQPSMRSLRHWMCDRTLRMRRTRCSGVLKATLESRARRRSDEIPSTGSRSGGAGREVVDGRSVPVGSEPPQVGSLVNVEVVPDGRDRAAALLMCGDQQVPVVAPGEALTAVDPPPCGYRMPRRYRREVQPVSRYGTTSST